jgi:hypothetical protein
MYRTKGRRRKNTRGEEVWEQMRERKWKGMVQ